MDKVVKDRLEKLKRLVEEGYPRYPNDFKPNSSSRELKERFGEFGEKELEALTEKFSVSGRIMLMRVFGRAMFINLQDESGRIQVYLREDVLGKERYRFFRKYVDIGDIVGIKGSLFKTRTGELTVLAEDYRILAKSLRPLPEKWHGLTDIELRYRYRYLDLIANRDVLERFKRRAEIIREIRRFFDERGFYEVETPMMHLIPGGANAKPFKTYHNALDLELYLRIAPELYLKRLLVGGFEKIYELGRNFRNEGISTQHNPEFTMVEFYQAYATYKDFMELTEELFSKLLEKFPESRSIRFNGRSVDISPPFEKIHMKEAVSKVTGLKESEIEDGERLRDYAVSLGLDKEDALSMTDGEILAWIFEEKVEDSLVKPTFVYGYPRDVSPLARWNDSDPQIADRFELFAFGMEIANGFSELNDPVEQRKRFEEQVSRAKERGEEKVVDEDFLMALEYGMPPAAGEGIGIDRLIMVFVGSFSIRDVILFPLLRPKKTD